MTLLFCNVSWMREYKGHYRVDQYNDQPQRGGRWVETHGTAHECCNFLSDDTGVVYGHVETWKGDEEGYDTQIKIEKLGASIEDSYIDNIDVVWTATHENGGRRIVGWYKHARVYRHRQNHAYYPTHQHKRDDVVSYRITAKNENVYLVPENNRFLKLGYGKGWPGHNPIFYPAEHKNNPEMDSFVEKLYEFMNGITQYQASNDPLFFSPESCGESTVYVPNKREVFRIHGLVVNQLYERLKVKHPNKNLFNTQLIDIAISYNDKVETIYEIKSGNDKQSIYTGIGQLLFHSKADTNISKILVLPQSNYGYKNLFEVLYQLDIRILEYYINDNDNITFVNL